MVRLNLALAVAALAVAPPALAWPFGRSLLAAGAKAAPSSLPGGDAVNPVVVFGDLPIKTSNTPSMKSADAIIAGTGKSEAEMAADVKHFYPGPTSGCAPLLASPGAESIPGTDKVRIWSDWMQWDNMTVRRGGEGERGRGERGESEDPMVEGLRPHVRKCLASVGHAERHGRRSF